MKRLAICAALALAAVLPGMQSHADTYCVQTGIEVFGEPWLSHQACFDCPIGPDCPDLPQISLGS